MTLKYPEDTAEKLFDRLGVYRRNLTEGQDSQMESSKLAEVERHFNQVMPLPSLQHLRELLEVSFIASLLTEEGEAVSFTIGYISPELGLDTNWSILRFSSPKPLTPGVLRRLSPTLVPDSVCCGVFPNAQGDLEVWGLVFLPRSIDFFESVDLPGITISSHQPGMIVVRHSTREVMIDSHGNAAFLDEPKSPDQTGLRMFLDKLVGDEPFPQTLRATAALIRLAKVVLHSGRGATFLVVPTDKEPTALSEPQIRADEQSRSLIARALQNPAFESLPNLVARLSFMDGAVVLDDALNLLAAGAMIQPPLTYLRSTPQEIHYLLIRPTQSADWPEPTSIDEFPGGSRHRSAVQFCSWNPGSVALVISQDGIMSLMSRLPNDDAVLILRPFYPNEAGF